MGLPNASTNGSLAEGDASERAERRQQLGAFYRRYGIIVILLLEMLLWTIMSPVFLTPSNMINVARQASFVGVVAADEVGAAVPDLPDQIPRSVQDDRRSRRPHATFVVLGEGALEDRCVRPLDRHPHPLRQVRVPLRARVPQFFRDDPYGHLTRHFPGRVPTHSVGDDEQTAIREHEVVVLVARADNTDIGAPGVRETHRCGHAIG